VHERFEITPRQIVDKPLNEGTQSSDDSVLIKHLKDADTENL